MPDLKPTRIRWLIVFLLVGFVFLGHFTRISMSVVGSEKFIGPGKLTEQQMGLVYSAFLLVYTIGMLPGGYVIDRVGPRWVLTGMGLGMGLLTALTGVLGWLGLSIVALFLPLLLIRTIAGATSVPLHPGAARAISLWVPLRQRSFSNGLVNAGAVLGISLCFPVFGRLLDLVDWQWAFLICGAVLVGFSLAWCLLSADSAESHRWTNHAERELISGGEPPPPPRASASLRDFFGLFRNRSLVILTISYGMLEYVQYLFFYWIGYYFNSVIHLPVAESRKATFIVMISMASGMACGGWIADWLCRKLGFTLGCRIMAITGMGLCALFSLLGVNMTDSESVVVCFSLALGSLGMCEGIFWTTAPTLERRNGGLACAMINTGGNGFGLLAPIFTPMIGKAFGWSAAIVVACALCAIGGTLWFAIRSPATEKESSAG